MLSLETITTKALFDFDGTLAKYLLETAQYPWEALPFIGESVLSIGYNLNKKEYKLIRGADGKKNVWISKTARIAKDANLYGPLIVGHNTEIRHNAFIRGNVLICENCVVGNSTEIKNSVLLNNVQVPHYNYVGDSILGNYSHLGAGVILSNLKSSKGKVYINREVETGLRKVGAFIGDYAEIGCNSVLNPGTVIGKNSVIYPTSCIIGVVNANKIISTKLTFIESEKKK